MATTQRDNLLNDLGPWLASALPVGLLAFALSGGELTVELAVEALTTWLLAFPLLLGWLRSGRVVQP